MKKSGIQPVFSSNKGDGMNYGLAPLVIFATAKVAKAQIMWSRSRSHL
jgi:hypothetical protein